MGFLSRDPIMILSSEHHANLTEVLKWRRDVRHFSTAALEPALLKQIEACVDFAPSVGNSRPWRIVRVNDKNRKAAIVRSFEECNRQASLIYQEKARQDYLALKLSGLIEAPNHLAFFTDLAPAEGRGVGRQTMPETLVYSTVMAIHTLWLTARALNVGVGWVSILDPQTVRNVLDVPESWQLTGYLCLGYPLECDDKPELHRIGWQTDTQSVWIDR
jgi:5,6-dimethylbenzimidazole synthase